MLNDLSRAAQGQEVKINFRGDKYTYDPIKNEWFDENGALAGTSLQSFVTGTLGISDPAFLGIKSSGSNTTSTGITYKLFEQEEEDALPILRQAYPNLVFNDKGADLFGIDKIQVETKDGQVIGSFRFENEGAGAEKEFEKFKSLIENYELAPNPNQSIQIDLDKL